MAASQCRASILRDASLRDAPQDEVRMPAAWLDTYIRGRGLEQRQRPPPTLPTRRDFARLRARSGREMRVVPFFVQIKCHLGKSYAVANAIADAEIASEIYSTAGEFDLLVKFYVEQGTDIGHFVNERVQTIPGVKDTLTILTFKAF
jgi:DNA-binding Lrp family transcriptional regulator